MLLHIPKENLMPINYFSTYCYRALDKSSFIWFRNYQLNNYRTKKEFYQIIEIYKKLALKTRETKIANHINDSRLDRRVSPAGGA